VVALAAAARASLMSGRSRLPGGEIRRASQKRTRRVGALPARIESPWRPGDRVLWRDRAGVYRRDVDEENAFIEIAERVYRVRRAELRQG
jgi:hypothetical protein